MTTACVVAAGGGASAVNNADEGDVVAATTTTLLGTRSNSNDYDFVVVENEIVEDLPGHTVENDYYLPLPHTYIAEHQLPKEFHWGNMDGKSYLTRNRNQHLPQW